MEKQYRSSNLLVVNHLPGILNMMHILNMLVYGFVASQPAYFVSAISSLQKCIRLSPKRQSRKKLISRLRNLYFFTLTTAVSLVLLATSSTINLSFIIASVALPCLANQLYTMKKRVIHPGRIMYLRNAIMQSVHLKNYFDKWFFVRR